MIGGGRALQLCIQHEHGGATGSRGRHEGGDALVAVTGVALILCGLSLLRTCCARSLANQTAAPKMTHRRLACLT